MQHDKRGHGAATPTLHAPQLVMLTCFQALVITHIHIDPLKA